MAETVIKVENLGKKYIISHQRGGRPMNFSLRDTITDRFARLTRAVRDRMGSANRPVSPHASYTEEFWALREVSFEIQQGDRVGVIGRNGAGKSTLLKILSRITEPTQGRINLHGRVASLLEVGTGFHPELTGRENIFLNGAILGMSRIEIRRKFDEIVDFAEIEKFIDTPVKRYSSGMYVRLAFAVAANLEPEILLVDEVLAVGDAQFQKKCLGKMEDVSMKMGRTVFFVSHNMNAVLSLCNRGLLLLNGALAFDGKVSDAVSRYVGNFQELSGTYVAKTKGPGKNGRLRIDKVTLLNNGTPSTSYQNTDRLAVRIEYTVYETLTGPQLCIEVATERDEVIFATTNQDVTGLKEEVGPGKYITECPLVLEMFREGRYFIKVTSSIPAVEVLDVDPEPLIFDLYNDESPIIKLGQGRRGVILPIIPWKQIL